MLLGDIGIDSKVCQETAVEKSLREYIRESDVVGECLQYVEKSTNGVEENTVVVVYTNSHYKRRNSSPCATEHPFYPCSVVLWTYFQM